MTVFSRKRLTAQLPGARLNLPCAHRSQAAHVLASVETGREARLPIVRLTIRVLLQLKFPSGPRTQNSPDLGAVNRTLV